MAEALTAFVRGGEAELVEDGAWLIGNALLNLEICARQLGKKDGPLPPVMADEEE